jgi:hypothetical protein
MTAPLLVTKLASAAKPFTIPGIFSLSTWKITRKFNLSHTSIISLSFAPSLSDVIANDTII